MCEACRGHQAGHPEHCLSDLLMPRAPAAAVPSNAMWTRGPSLLFLAWSPDALSGVPQSHVSHGRASLGPPHPDIAHSGHLSPVPIRPCHSLCAEPSMAPHCSGAEADFKASFLFPPSCPLPLRLSALPAPTQGRQLSVRSQLRGLVLRDHTAGGVLRVILRGGGDPQGLCGVSSVHLSLGRHLTPICMSPGL